MHIFLHYKKYSQNIFMPKQNYVINISVSVISKHLIFLKIFLIKTVMTNSCETPFSTCFVIQSKILQIFKESLLHIQTKYNFYLNGMKILNHHSPKYAVFYTQTDR